MFVFVVQERQDSTETGLQDSSWSLLQWAWIRCL